jgi:hypothetical protein
MQLWPPISWKVRFLSEEKCVCVYFFGSQYVIAIVQILKTLLKRLKKLFFFLLGDEADFPNSFFKMRLLFFQMFWGSIFELFITVLAYPVLP